MIQGGEKQAQIKAVWRTSDALLEAGKGFVGSSGGSGNGGANVSGAASQTWFRLARANLNCVQTSTSARRSARLDNRLAVGLARGVSGLSERVKAPSPPVLKARFRAAWGVRAGRRGGRRLAANLPSGGSGAKSCQTSIP